MQRFKKNDCGCESVLDASSVSMSPIVTDEHVTTTEQVTPESAVQQEGPRIQRSVPAESTDNERPSPPPRGDRSKQSSSMPQKLDQDLTKQPVPGSISTAIKADKSLVRVDENVVYEITLSNTGGSPVRGVDLKATFTDNLLPISIEPAGSGSINKNVVTFKTIDSLNPTTLTYKITAKAQRSSRANGRVEIETNASILSSPLSRTFSTPINP